MHVKSTALAVLLAAVAASTASAQVVITEIGYNIAGSEGGASEWVEIYNNSDSIVDLTGWVYGDAQDNTFYPPFPTGTTLAPRTAAALIYQPSAEGSPDHVAIFRSIWGPNVNVIPNVAASPVVTLANAATATNERVVIQRPIDGGLFEDVDSVNFENNLNSWPDDNGASTIYLLPTAIDPLLNDVGSNWANSTNGVDGAYTALILNPLITNAAVLDVASPGFVQIANNPATVKGDFGGNESSNGSFNTPDGAFNELDVEGFLLALNDQAAYLSLNAGLGSTLLTRGDFGGNESTDGSFNTPDGSFNELDVEGFLLALNNPTGYAAIQPPGLGGVSAIPEPAALGLLAPMGLLLSRRCR